MVVRVGRLEGDRAARIRVHRPDVDLVAVTRGAGAAVVADRQRQEVEHQVRVGDVVVRAGEPAALEMVGRAGPAPEEQPLGADERPAPELGRGRLHRDGLEAPVLDVDLEVVLEVGTDARQVGHDGDAEVLQVRRRADAGELEQLRRVDRAARQDDLAALDPLRSPTPPLDVDGDGARPLEHDAGHERPRPDGQVATAADRLQVGLRRRDPATAVDVAIERPEAFLAIAVDVLGQLVAGFLAGLEEGREQRVGRRAALQDQRPVVAAPRVVRGGRETRLHLLEVRQAVGVVPGRHARVGGPALVVERVAALEDLAVDARRAAEDPAARVVDAPAAHERLGLGVVAPVVVAAADRERQRRRHVDEHVEPVVRPPGFEDEDARRGVRRQPIGERAAGRPAADDDEVEARGRHGPDASSAPAAGTVLRQAGASRRRRRQARERAHLKVRERLSAVRQRRMGVPAGAE